MAGGCRRSPERGKDDSPPRIVIAGRLLFGLFTVAVGLAVVCHSELASHELVAEQLKLLLFAHTVGNGANRYAPLLADGELEPGFLQITIELLVASHARTLATVAGPSGRLTRSSSIRSEQARARTAGLGSRSLRTADSSRERAIGPSSARIWSTRIRMEMPTGYSR
jgi:hypothetical protein